MMSATKLGLMLPETRGLFTPEVLQMAPDTRSAIQAGLDQAEDRYDTVTGGLLEALSEVCAILNNGTDEKNKSTRSQMLDAIEYVNKELQDALAALRVPDDEVQAALKSELTGENSYFSGRGQHS